MTRKQFDWVEALLIIILITIVILSASYLNLILSVVVCWASAIVALIIGCKIKSKYLKEEND